MTYFEKALTIHGDRYDYSQTTWGGSHDKITIICRKHGPFEQYTNHHLDGADCRKCQAEKKSSGREGFVEKARKKHGDRYDYSQVEYANARTKVAIVCSVHGPFSQTPDAHTTQGQGCPRCNPNHWTKEELLSKLMEVHGDRYDYTEVVFKTTNDKIKVICPKHGLFEPRLSHHLDGMGCRLCRDEAMWLDETTFLQKAEAHHENIYDYSKVRYQGAFEKVEIICPVHGSFWQTPDSHANAGHGCQQCFHAPMTTERFVREAQAKHGDRYDYSQTLCFTYADKITIICPVHGEFQQKVSNHLAGKGCARCAGKLKTHDDFIAHAREVHGEKYDYSKTTYVNSTSKVIITCPDHGDFHQEAGSHVYIGAGCPACSFNWKRVLSNADDVPGMLYFVRFTNYKESFLKIGLTTKTVQERFKSIRRYFDLQILHTINSDSLRYIYELEQKLLTDYADYKYVPVSGFEGTTECLRCDPALESRILSRLTSLFPLEGAAEMIPLTNG